MTAARSGDRGPPPALADGDRRMTIRFRLGLGLAVALLPILLLGGLQTYVAFRHDAEVRRTSLAQAGERSAVEARARIQSAIALLEAIAAEPADAACSARLAGLKARLDGYANIVRLDAQGRPVCSAAPLVASVDRASRPWFVAVRSGAPVALGKALKAAEPTLVVAVRLPGAKGPFEGVVAAGLRLGSLRPDLKDETLPHNTAVALIDSRGEFLLQTDPRAFGPLPSTWSQGRAQFSGRDQAGEYRTFVVAPLVKDNLSVLLSAPAPGVLSWARINPFASIILPLLMWAAAWLVVWVVTDRVVVRWLAYLDRVAGLFAKGRFSVRAVHADRAPREIRDLARTMDAMAETITARDALLNDNLAQKDALMREIHHRVKNNLQVITSLLNMQQRALADPAARTAIFDTRQRITALALIYRALYQSEDLRRIDVRQFLEELIASQMTSESGRAANLRTELTADDLDVDPDKLAPLALFAVEAIAQARKHIFPPEGGVVKVRFTVADRVVMEIEDDGDPAEDAGDGVGRTLMTAYARQLRGTTTTDTTPAGHLRVRLDFPAPQGTAAAPPSDGAPAPQVGPAMRSEVAGGNQARA